MGHPQLHCVPASHAHSARHCRRGVDGELPAGRWVPAGVGCQDAQVCGGGGVCDGNHQGTPRALAVRSLRVWTVRCQRHRVRLLPRGCRMPQQHPAHPGEPLAKVVNRSPYLQVPAWEMHGRGLSLRRSGLPRWPQRGAVLAVPRRVCHGGEELPRLPDGFGGEGDGHGGGERRGVRAALPALHLLALPKSQNALQDEVPGAERARPGERGGRRWG
mmetsp:Transcript_47586/g.90827  ORF Transcript_47586/g.90827 Transcript_47586/m.90827 type:complete len:216 (-) Transcript_47586:11-658(-)